MTQLSSSIRLGVFCMIAGMFLISINDMLIKWLSGGYPLHQLVLMRSIVGMLFSLVILYFEGGWKLLRTGKPGLHALRGLLVVLANTTFFAALAALSLGTSTALYFVALLIVTLLSIPVLGEQVGPRRFAAIGFGFVGVLIMMAPQFDLESGGAGWVVVLPVLAATFYSGMAVLTRKLGQGSRASVLSLHLHLAFIIVSLGMIVAVGDGRYLTPETGDSLTFLLRAWIWPAQDDLVMILLIGLASGGIGYFMTQAYRLSPVSVVAPFEYILLIFALFWGWMIFGDWPPLSVFVGAVIVIGSGIFVVLREGRPAPRKVRQL